MNKKKLLIISDSVTASSGLARIARDLASRVNNYLNDKFRVCTIGYGGTYSRKFPWVQYPIQDPIPNGWQISELPTIYEDFCDGEECIILTIWDASRLGWMADHHLCTIPQLQSFIKDAPIKKWGYWPIDASGPNQKLSEILAYTISKFDRNLAYTQWAADILDRTFHGTKHDHLPHGLNTELFYPRNKKQAREKLANEVFQYSLKNTTVIGIVATNQSRKNYGLAFAAAQELLSRGRNIRLWVNTDKITRFWDFNSLVADFGLKGKVAITLGLKDEDIAQYYNACDVTWGIGESEGWGFPLAESLASGVPVIHGNNGGGSDFVPKEFLVNPVVFEYDGAYNSHRPTFRVKDWADKTEESLGKTVTLPDCIKWENAWPKWEEWFLRGLDD